MTSSAPAAPAASDADADAARGSAPVRFGVVGCGGIGRWHARNIRLLPGLELAAVADPDPQARARAGRDFGAPACAGADELLARGDVDAVSICAPPAVHAHLIEAAAAAGKHVLVEKPLALTVVQANRAISACEQAGVLLAVVHQQRARSSTRALERLLREGAFGTPLLASVVHTWFKTQAQLDRDPWRGDAASGGGLLLDQAVHGLDLLVWFLGEPAWVVGASATLARRTRGEDTAAAVVGFRSGLLATLAAGAAANGARDDIALELAGTRGGFRLEVRDYDDAEIVRLELARSDEERAHPLPADEVEDLVRCSGGAWRAGPRAPLWRIAGRLAGGGRGVHAFRSPRAWLRRQADRAAQAERREPQGHAAVLANMAAAIRGEAQPLVSGTEARRSLAIVEGIRVSEAAGGRRVSLPDLVPA
ncbi:MAG: Gfo/Idh/MocA family protein [Gemmatimonadota bacterium]